MKCPHCGKEHSDSAKFCENTGKELLKACPWEDCADYGKAILPMRAKFCPRCGRPLQETTEQSEQTFTVNGVEFKMIKVEGGTFSMGATPEQTGDAYDYEEPVHSVTLSDYYMGETEVTQELWQAVMGSNPSHFTGNNQRPVECVTWDDCQKFIKELNRLTGRSFRLPTEAEWEYAARGGKHGEKHTYKYSGSNNPDEVAWYWQNSGDKYLSGEWDWDKIKNNNCKTHPVKTKKANKLGLYDMSGNVCEWCNDWSEDYQSSPQINPKGPAMGGNRVVRGGCWSVSGRYVRVSDRCGSTPCHGSDDLGLRLALSL